MIGTIEALSKEVAALRKQVEVLSSRDAVKTRETVGSKRQKRWRNTTIFHRDLKQIIKNFVCTRDNPLPSPAVTEGHMSPLVKFRARTAICDVPLYQFIIVGVSQYCTECEYLQAGNHDRDAHFRHWWSGLDGRKGLRQVYDLSGDSSVVPGLNQTDPLLLAYPPFPTDPCTRGDFYLFHQSSQSCLIVAVVYGKSERVCRWNLLLGKSYHLLPFMYRNAPPNFVSCSRRIDPRFRQLQFAYAAIRIWPLWSRVIKSTRGILSCVNKMLQVPLSALASKLARAMRAEISALGRGRIQN